MSVPNNKAIKKVNVADHFSSIAHIYNDRNYVKAGKRAKYPDIAIRHQYFLEMLRYSSGRALEIGCGSGQMLHDLLLRDFEVVGMDIAPGMIKASRKLIQENLPHAKASLLIGDIENIALPSNHFDVVVAAGVIEYLGSDKKIFQEFNRVLKPGGIAIISVRNKINLSRFITTGRDLLEETPCIGKGIEAASNLVRSMLSLPPNGGIPGRRHIPWKLKEELLDADLYPVDDSFYHFAVFPRPLERRYGELCTQWAQKLEVFRRSPLGYLANQYIVKARKVA